MTMHNRRQETTSIVSQKNSHHVILNCSISQSIIPVAPRSSNAGCVMAGFLPTHDQARISSASEESHLSAHHDIHTDRSLPVLFGAISASCPLLCFLNYNADSILPSATAFAKPPTNHSMIFISDMVSDMATGHQCRRQAFCHVVHSPVRFTNS